MSEFSASNDGAQTVVSQAQEKVQETAQQATGAAGKAVREQVEQRAGQAADELRSVAGAMRRSGDSLRAEGSETSAKAVDAVVGRIDALGSYLSEANGDRMLADVERFGRRQPWALVGVGLAAGFAASRFLKASSRSRYSQPQRLPVTTASPIPPAPAAPYTPPVAEPIGGSVTPR
jgi:hypothetical protein